MRSVWIAIAFFILIIILLNASIVLLTEKKDEQHKDKVQQKSKRHKRWLAVLFITFVTLLANILTGIVSGFLTNRFEESYKGVATGTIEQLELPAVTLDGVNHGAGIGWGDNGNGRASFSKAQIESGVLGTHILLNSVSDGAIGNEKKFLSIKEIGTDDWLSGDVDIEEEKEYYLRIYVANDNLRYPAEGVTATLALQKDVGKSVAITGYIDSTNADPSEMWCDIRLNADRDFYLKIVPGSGMLQTEKMTTMISDQIITSSGVLIGYDKLDGDLPGGKDAYVVIKVVPIFVE